MIWKTLLVFVAILVVPVSLGVVFVLWPIQVVATFALVFLAFILFIFWMIADVIVSHKWSDW
mgnify:FL=1